MSEANGGEGTDGGHSLAALMAGLRARGWTPDEPAGPPLAGRADAAVVQIGDTRLEGVHVEVRDDDAAVRPSKDP